LYRESDLPLGWGALVELDNSLVLRVKPTWHDNSAESRLRFLQRIAVAGTRHLNRQLEIDFDLVQAERRKLF
jgi:predicted SprT family Zn-dependent metalloprotease